MEKYCSLILKKQIYKHGHLNENEAQTDRTPRQDEWRIDHIIPKSKGRTNSYSNAQVLSRQENRLKWDSYEIGRASCRERV